MFGPTTGKLADATRSVIETLEQRRLLTYTPGGIGDPDLDGGSAYELPPGLGGVGDPGPAVDEGQGDGGEGGGNGSENGGDDGSENGDGEGEGGVVVSPFANGISITGSGRGLLDDQRTFGVAAGSELPEGTTYHWQVRDAQGNLVAEGDQSSFAFGPAAAGEYLITVTVEDGEGHQATASTPYVVLPMRPDPIFNGDRTKLALVVDGTDGDDVILISPSRKVGSLTLSFNGVVSRISPPAGAAITRIIADGRNGNDQVIVDLSVTTPAILYGGNGNDRLRGGGGHDVLIGGDGNDQIGGGPAGELLIGGRGNDRLYGKPGSDILIGGYTDLDEYSEENQRALCHALTRWLAARSVDMKLQRLQRNLGPFMHDDGEVDRLAGGRGYDQLIKGLADGGLLT